MVSKSFVYCFDDVEVCEREFSLSKAGEVVTIEPKAFRALLFLLHNREKLVRKEELLHAVWGDTAVTDNSLTRCIWLLRNVLGEDTRNPRYIETVPTVGYRFIAHVEERVESSESVIAPVGPGKSELPGMADQAPKRKTFSRRWTWIGVTSLVLILVASIAVWVGGWASIAHAKDPLRNRASASESFARPEYGVFRRWHDGRTDH